MRRTDSRTKGVKRTAARVAGTFRRGARPTGLTFNPNGSWSFDASSYDSLVADEQLVLTIPFTARTRRGRPRRPANLVITVTGTGAEQLPDGFI